MTEFMAKLDVSTFCFTAAIAAADAAAPARRRRRNPKAMEAKAFFPAVDNLWG